MDILNASFALFSSEKEGEQAGADDLVPALTYAIIKAKPDRLLQSMKFIKDYGMQTVDPASKDAYSITTFEIAVEDIKNTY